MLFLEFISQKSTTRCCITYNIHTTYGESPPL